MALTIHKVVAALPATLAPDALYAVRTGTGFDLHLADSTGSVAHKVNAADLMAMPVRQDAPVPPPAGQVSLYPRRRAGYEFLDLLRASGRGISMQPHVGRHQVSTWWPTGSAEVRSTGLAQASGGGIHQPSCDPSGLLSSILRWRMVTDEMVAGRGASNRGVERLFHRGTAPKRGGYLIIMRFGVTGICSGSGCFFGLHNTNAFFEVFDPFATANTVIGIGFKQGTHSNWQAICGTGAGKTVIDMGPNWPITDTASLLTLYLYCEPNGNSVFLRLVNETTDALFDTEFTANLPPKEMAMAPRLHIDNGTAAARAAFDCAGVYMETNF